MKKEQFLILYKVDYHSITGQYFKSIDIQKAYMRDCTVKYKTAPQNRQNKDLNDIW